eukprot:6170751-Amphidinium_carterae.1
MASPTSRPRKRVLWGWLLVPHFTDTQSTYGKPTCRVTKFGLPSCEMQSFLESLHVRERYFAFVHTAPPWLSYQGLQSMSVASKAEGGAKWRMIKLQFAALSPLVFTSDCIDCIA